jgi:hypothetical protein
MSLGTLVINEKVFQIRLIELKHSTIVLTATRETMDELTITPGMETRIHAPDGSLIGVLALSLPDGPLTVKGDPARNAPAYMTVIQPLGITEFVGKSAWPKVRT